MAPEFLSRISEDDLQRVGNELMGNVGGCDNEGNLRVEHLIKKKGLLIRPLHFEVDDLPARSKALGFPLAQTEGVLVPRMVDDTKANWFTELEWAMKKWVREEKIWNRDKDFPKRLLSAFGVSSVEGWEGGNFRIYLYKINFKEGFSVCTGSVDDVVDGFTAAATALVSENSWAKLIGTKETSGENPMLVLSAGDRQFLLQKAEKGATIRAIKFLKAQELKTKARLFVVKFEDVVIP